MSRSKANSASPLLAAVQETAGDLHRLGYIDQRRMRQIDALCLACVPAYGSAQIRGLRERLQLSQTVLASVPGISPSTVRKWEQDVKQPSGPPLKLLHLLARKGLEAVL